MSADLAAFLLARYDDEEAAARAAVSRNGITWSTDELPEGVRITGTTEFGNPRSYRGDTELWDDEGAMGMFAETAAHIARWDPARVLAECEARRRIVEQRVAVYEGRGLPFGCPPDYDDGYIDALDYACKLLALPFADHPDFDPAWRP